MIKKTLRPHQIEAVNSCIEAAKAKTKKFYLNCCVSFGKSLVIADLSEKALNKNNRVLVLTPSKELCEQNYKESFEYMSGPHNIGIVCSGLGKAQINKKCVIATYQSFLNKRAVSGKFNIVFIDECHMISNDELTSIRKIIKSLERINPKLISIGFTGSPYRMKGQGLLENDNQEGRAFFEKCVYTSDISQMIKDGYLSHLLTINSEIQIDLSGINSSDEYSSKLVGVKFNEIVGPAVADMKEKFQQHNIKTAALFTSTVDNANRIADEWNDSSEIRVLHGETSHKERRDILKWIVDGTGPRYIVNVGILTTGWNFPALDCVALLRATKSLSLYLQIIGRVIRAHKCDKGIEKIGMVYDVGGNIDRHGSIDSIVPPKPKKRRGDMPKKLCDATLDTGCIDDDGVIHFPGMVCNTINILSAKYCKLCKAKFIPIDDSGHYKMQTKAQALAQDTITYDVNKISYEFAVSQKDGTHMIKMKFDETHKHYLCLDHKGFAKENSNRFLMHLFKDPKDFYKLGTVGVNVKNMLPLLQNQPQFFKTIKSFTLKPGKNSKYKEIKTIVFEKD